MENIYFDYAATTPVHPEVLEAMLPYLQNSYGNPSTLYSYGQEAKEAVEEARSSVAGLVGAEPEEIVFTSGGTEADNSALEGVAFARGDKGNHIITTMIEHHAILETCQFLEGQGFNITYLPVDSTGMVDPGDVKKAITGKTILVSVMHANNEIGTVQPIAQIGRITREAGIYFHTDAVQTAGHIPTDVNKLGVDLLSMSAHKLYGPKGVGALYIRKGTKTVSFVHGGAQERGRRAGTENVPGIVALGKAAEIVRREMFGEAERLTGLRNRLVTGIMGRIDHTSLNGHPLERLPNNVNVSIGFIEGESIVLALDAEGICASTGSACSTGSLEPSHVLTAIRISSEQARGSVRFTLGRWTTEDEIEQVLEILPVVVARLRKISPLVNI